MWLNSLDESGLVRGCLEWPAPKYPDPPFPAAAHPHIPVLVLDGEFDQATPVADARRVAAAWPDSTYVQVANTGHISAMDDYEGCATAILRRFLTHLAAGNTSCAARIPAVNAVQFPGRLAQAPPAQALPGNRATAAGRRAAWVASQTVGDAMSRWYDLMFGEDGHGLRGGKFTVPSAYLSHGPLVINFHGDRFVSGLAVSGRAIWNRTTLRVRATLRLTGAAGTSGTITVSFPTNRRHGRATVTGTVGGLRLRARLAAPWTTQG